MKRVAYFILSFVIILLFAACDSASSLPKNSIQQSEHSEKEELLISNLTDQFFIFDYRIGNGMNEVKIWTERYVKGKRVDDDTLNISSTLNEKTGKIAITNIDSIEEHTRIMSASIIGKEGSDYTRHLERYKIPDNVTISSLFGSGAPIRKNQPIVLGSIVYYDSELDKSLEEIDLNDISNPQDNQELLEKYDLIYLFKCEFY